MRPKAAATRDRGIAVAAVEPGWLGLRPPTRVRFIAFFLEDAGSWRLVYDSIMPGKDFFEARHYR